MKILQYKKQEIRICPGYRVRLSKKRNELIWNQKAKQVVQLAAVGLQAEQEAGTAELHETNQRTSCSHTAYELFPVTWASHD